MLLVWLAIHHCGKRTGLYRTKAHDSGARRKAAMFKANSLKKLRGMEGRVANCPATIRRTPKYAKPPTGRPICNCWEVLSSTTYFNRSCGYKLIQKYSLWGCLATNSESSIISTKQSNISPLSNAMTWLWKPLCVPFQITFWVTWVTLRLAQSSIITLESVNCTLLCSTLFLWSHIFDTNSVVTGSLHFMSDTRLSH